VFIHQRAATRGGTSLETTHFWQAGSYFYCHNGVFRGEKQKPFQVDSQVLGHILETEGLWSALEYMQGQDYSNVFLVDMEKEKWYMSRSNLNTLYTNVYDDYSTDKLTDICDVPVQKQSIVTYDFDIPPIKGWNGNYPDTSSAHNFNSYQEILDAEDEEYQKAVAMTGMTEEGPEDE
jgi:hypothetical protein